MEENRLKLIRDDLGGISQAKLAANTDIPLHKIKDAESGKVKISAEIAKIMEDKFGYSFRWVLTGEGPKTKEAPRQSTMELREPQSSFISEPPRRRATDRIIDEPRFRISDALAMAARILESGTSYAAALYLNIVQFDRAVHGEASIAQVEKNLLTLQQDVEDIKSGIEEIRQEHRNERAAPEIQSGDTLETLHAATPEPLPEKHDARDLDR